MLYSIHKSKILIAGVSGYVGSFLFEKLHNQYDITGLKNSRDSTHTDFFSLDLTVEAEVKSFSQNAPKCDVLIFLVGLAHKRGKGKELDEFRRINKQTLVNLLSVLEKKGKRPGKIIFASTVSVYGEKMNQNIYKEDSEKYPFSPYAVTKLEAEDYLLEHFAEKAWVLRFAPVYSPDFQ